MMNFVPTLDIYVTKVEDLRDKISDDVYECVESLVNECEGEYEGKFFDIKEEFECYESQLDVCRNAMRDSVRVLEKVTEQLDELYDYIRDSKRLNRDKINNMLKDVDLSDIIMELNSSM